MCRFRDHIRRNITLIALISLLLFFPSCRYIRQRFNLGEYSLKSAIEWAKKDSVRVADSLKRIMAEKEVFEKTLTDSLMSIEGQNLPGGDQNPRYYIITGSFANHDNALQASGKYTGEGFKTTIIKVPGKEVSLELVSVKTFSDHSEAQAFLKGFKGIYDPGAWIYTMK